MAVVGLVVAFGTGTGLVEWDVFRQTIGNGDPIERFWLVSLGLTHLALLFALSVAVTALVVHRAETLLENTRSMAALAAAGAPMASLRKSAMRQTLIAAAPVCTIAAVAVFIGISPGIFWEPDLPLAAWMAGRALLMVALAVAAATTVTALSGRLLTRAAAPSRLRAE